MEGRSVRKSRRKTAGHSDRTSGSQCHASTFMQETIQNGHTCHWRGYHVDTVFPSFSCNMRSFQLRSWSARVAGLQVWNQTPLRGSGAPFATATVTPTRHAPEEESQRESGSVDGGSVSSADVGALCQQGRLKEAFGMLDSIDNRSIQGHLNTYGELIQGCAKFKALDIGKQVHAHMINKGLESNSVIENLLVTMYSKCGSVKEARKIFDEMPKRSVIAWTAMAAGVAQEGRIDEALRYLSQMQKEGVKPDAVFFISVLNGVTTSRDIENGKLIHLQIVECGLESNIPVANALISMYARCGSVQEACKVFDKMSERDIISWTALLNLYCRLGHLVEAQKLFDLMPMRDIVSWSAMIAGHAKHGRGEDAFDVLRKMQEAGVKPDKVTYLSILNACKSPKFLERGKQIHAHIVKAKFDSDVRLGNALVKMYTKCGSLADARQVFDKMARKDVVSWTALLNSYLKFRQVKEARGIFDEMPNRDVIAWNSMISGYAKSGEGEKALELFHQIEKEHIAPNDMTYVGALNACARTRSLQQGLDVHTRVLISGYEGDLYVQNAIIDMYIKCRSVETAHDFFEKMPVRDVVSWNSMLFGFIHSGRRREALNLYTRMLADGVKPNGITFLAVLSVCKKEGLFAEGSRYFASMRRDHKIKPTWQHYTLLNKGGAPADGSRPAKTIMEVPVDELHPLEPKATVDENVGLQGFHPSM